MTNTALVLSKLSTLREHVDRMERRRPAPLDEFRDDVDRQDTLALICSSRWLKVAATAPGRCRLAA